MVELTVADKRGAADSTSKTVAVTDPGQQPPNAPSNLIASVTTSGKGKKVTKSVVRTWTDNSTDEDYFDIEQCEEFDKKRQLTDRGDRGCPIPFDVDFTSKAFDFDGGR